MSSHPPTQPLDAPFTTTMKAARRPRTMQAAAALLVALPAIAVAAAAEGQQHPHPPHAHDDNTVLSSLLGPIPGKENFFKEFWQAKPAVIRRHNPTFYHPIMQQGDLDAILVHSTTASLMKTLTGDADHHPQNKEEDEAWKLVKRIKRQDGEWWSSSPNAAARTQMLGLPSDATDVDVARAAFAQGYSLVVNHLEDKWHGTSQLALSFEQELGYRTSTNCYFTPAQSQAFEAHFDWMDAFVLQVEGSKRWRLYDALVERPRPDMQFKPTTQQIGESFIDFVLEAGDLLYLPSGLIHEALTELEDGSGGSSLHLTVGVETTVLGSWESLLLEVLVVATAVAGEGKIMHSSWASLTSLQCPGGAAGRVENDEGGEQEVQSVAAIMSAFVPTITTEEELRQGDLVALTLMHLATQERGLRRPVPLTPLMKRTSDRRRLGQLKELVTLVNKQADVQAAWEGFYEKHNGTVPRSLAVFGKANGSDDQKEAAGKEMERRLAAAAAAGVALSEEAKQGVNDALLCLERALLDTTQAKAVLKHFDGVCQQDLMSHQQQRKATLEQGVWQANIASLDGKMDAPQVYGVGSHAAAAAGVSSMS